MSNIALSWAFKCHVGNASAKAVLVYLADRADDDGTAAYPKIATIVNDAPIHCQAFGCVVLGR